MIDRVIICGVRRANELLPLSEIKQGIGRAGRSYTKTGKAVILVPENDELYAWKCFNDSPAPIVSEMSDIDSIAFHILPWIDNINDESSFRGWYSKTLACVQGKEIKWEDVRNYLEETDLVKNGVLSDFGKVSLKLYFSPARLLMMRQKLKEAYFNDNIDSPFTLSWIMAYHHMQVGNADAVELGVYKNDIKMYGYTFDNGELIHGYAYFCLLANKRPKWMKHILSTEMDDLPRLFRALSLIAGIDHIPVQDKLTQMKVSAMKRVPPEIAKIMSIFSFEHKGLAYELSELGVSTVDELEDKEDYVNSYGSEQLKTALKHNGFLKNSVISELKGKIDALSENHS